MAVSRKISQLTALASASLNTQVVGVDGGSTIRVSLNTIKDAVATTINDTNDARLDSLEQYTSSAAGANVTSLNSFTSSYFIDSASFSTRIVAATNEQSFAGLISGSSQLTSSFDQRYTLSGSITQTTWSNISGKPLGIVSQSTDLSSINSFTQSIDGRVDSLESWSSSLTNTFATDLEVSVISSSVAATIGIISTNAGLVTTSSFNSYTASISTASLVDRLNAIESLSGSWITESETGSFLKNLNGAISSSSQLTASYDTRYTLSGSVQPLPSNLISSSAQITTLGFISSSTISLGTISSSAQITSLGFVSGSYLTSLDGAISSSSQITSSLDLRYQLSGSAGVVPIGTISGSAQITAFGFISSSGAIPDGTISGSSQLTSSYDTRYETRGRGIISGSSQITGILAPSNLSTTGQVSASVFVGGYLVPEAKFTVVSSKPMTFWPNYSFESVRFTTAGGVIIGKNGETNDFGNKLDVSGSVRFIGNTTVTGSLNVTQGITGSIAATNGVISGSSQLTSSYDIRYAPSASYLTSLNGAISSSNQLTSSFELKGSGIYSSSAQLPAGIISGSSQLPLGIVSGSSQLTSSLDLRYQLSGSAGVVPAGTISGSSQLTSSFDNRYVLETETGSLQNSITSLNTLTSSLATTGSNSFNGNQVVTGSLTVSSVATISSSIAANASALTLSSGSNLYIQNNGVAEISGSLIVSGSTILTGSISISSGSITMPNRPGVRVTGAGGAKSAVSILSGSYLNIDWQQSNAWDNSTGTFTAPIAGLYQVNVVVRTNSNTLGTISQLIVYKNYTGAGTGTAQIMVEFGSNTTMNHTGGSTISKLAVGDTLRMVVAVGDISFDANDNFSVAYIG